MNATADRPSAVELTQLSQLLNASPLVRADLVAALRRLEQGLREHGRELDRSDGLLNEADKARRMSLSREDDRLRAEGSVLVADIDSLRQAAIGGADEDDLRRRGGALLAGLQGHRDAEVGLVLENADTEVGAGD